MKGELMLPFLYYLLMNFYKNLRSVFFSALILAPILVSAQKNDWENPEKPSFNTVPAHAHFIPKEAPKLSLDGMWRFRIVQNPSLRSTDFFKNTDQTKNWKQIKVPANWQTEGFDKYIFTDVEYPIPPNPPLVPKDYNPVGEYQKDFVLGPSWQGKQVFIHLGAVNSFFYLWVNGSYMGFSKDSKTPTEFDITKVLKPGKNTVSLQVFRFSDATYLEGQDMWKLSGIERSVYLIARPVVHLADFNVKATLDETYKDGLMDLKAVFSQLPSKTNAQFLKVQLSDKSGKVWYEAKQQIKNLKEIKFSTRIANVKTWNAEHPNLYQLKLSHVDSKGKTIETIAHSIGFRTAEVKGGLFLINGVPLKIKGVNRHEHNMYTARVITEADMIQDIRLMKELNVNAVRTSHYPNSERWYSLCDEYGLYVIDEANIECDGMSFTPQHTLSDNPLWKNAYLDRIQRMWERDKNFTSIITWSTGNESGFGENLKAAYRWLKAHDDTRPVQYEAAREEAYSDIYCPMYKPIREMEKYVEEWRSRPYIQCEYAHMMGNSGGNLKDDWDLIYKHPQLQGGFIWDFSDQTFAIKDKQGNNIWGYGRDMGNVGLTSDTSFCADGLLSAGRTFHPQAYELQRVYQNVGFELTKPSILKVINRFDFTNLDQYQFSWFIKADGKLVAEGKLGDLNISPTQSKEIELNIPSFSKQAGTEYFLTVQVKTKSATALIPAGFTVATAQFELPAIKMVSKADNTTYLTLQKTADNREIKVYNNLFSVSFDKQTGWLKSYAIENVPVIKEALKPHFWRAATDNDIGNSMQIRCKVWQNVADNAKLNDISIANAGANQLIIKTTHSLPTVDAKYITEYIISGNGDVQVNATMLAGEKLVPELPRFGMQVILNKEFDQVTWLGRGPFDNYWDRKFAADVDLYTLPADSLFFPYARAQESGYRTDIRWMALRNKNGIGLMAIGAPQISAGVLHFNMNRLNFNHYASENNHGGSMTNEDLISWNIDDKQMGVGGDNSWGAKTHQQYTLPYQNYSYSFTLRMVNALELSKQAKK